VRTPQPPRSQGAGRVIKLDGSFGLLAAWHRSSVCVAYPEKDAPRFSIPSLIALPREKQGFSGTDSLVKLARSSPTPRPSGPPLGNGRT